MLESEPNPSILTLLKQKLFPSNRKHFQIHHFLRTVFFLFCLGNLINQLSYIAEGYIHNRYSSRLTYVSVNKIELPYIRICSPGWPNRTAFREHDVTQDVFNYMLDFFHNGYFRGAPMPKKKEAKVEQQYHNLMRKVDYKMMKLFRKISMRCDYLFRGCFVGSLAIQCCAKNTTKVQLTERGICYVLNYHEHPQLAPIQQLKPGPSGGFVFHFVEDSEILDVNSKVPTFQGLMLSTVEENFGIALFESDPVAIPPASLAMVQLDLTKTKLITGCKNYKEKSIDPKKMAESGVQACEKKIHLDAIERQCSCLPYNFVSQYWDKNYCTPIKYKKCVYPLMLKLENNMSTSACVQECEDQEFSQRLSYSKFNDVVYKKLYAPDLNSSRYSITEVHLFMAQRGYIFTEEVEMQSWHMLVANFGGQLGLWLGVSVLGTTGFVVQLAKYLFLAKRQETLKKQEKTFEQQSNGLYQKNADVRNS